MSSILSETQIPSDSDFGLFSLVHGDVLGGAIGRFAIRSRLYAVSLAVLLSFSAAIVTALEGNFINPQINLDLFHDIGWWNQFLLAFPTLVYIAGSYFGEFPKTLAELVDTGVIQASERDWKKVRRYTSAKLSNPTFLLLPYVVGFSAMAISFNATQASGTWFNTADFNAGWLVPLHSFFLYFFMTYLALRLYTAYLILSRLFSFKVNIQPFHPDSCGGLGSLEKQSGKLYLGMVGFGFAAAFTVVSNVFVYATDLFSIYNVFFLLSYFIMMAICYFLPLYALSDSMNEAKQRLLITIKERHKLLDQKIASGDDTEDSLQADLEALDTLRQTARSMHVWPFDRTSIKLFLLGSITPVLIIALIIVIYPQAI
ncbi:MAG: hypothetical protein DHS20C12_28740 [Pseudohongiella sp.]|nr:MAG: hypothetical protein DHS20C12_28740 [Pseudohongiella sp.]